eukprot:21558-Eustigmatos_ZCMA.PRE.1
MMLETRPARGASPSSYSPVLRYELMPTLRARSFVLGLSSDNLRCEGDSASVTKCDGGASADCIHEAERKS